MIYIVETNDGDENKFWGCFNSYEAARSWAIGIKTKVLIVGGPSYLNYEIHQVEVVN